jgi:hypothetical protein
MACGLAHTKAGTALRGTLIDDDDHIIIIIIDLLEGLERRDDVGRVLLDPALHILEHLHDAALLSPEERVSNQSDPPQSHREDRGKMIQTGCPASCVQTPRPTSRGRNVYKSAQSSRMPNNTPNLIGQDRAGGVHSPGR